MLSVTNHKPAVRVSDQAVISVASNYFIRIAKSSYPPRVALSPSKINITSSKIVTSQINLTSDTPTAILNPIVNGSDTTELCNSTTALCDDTLALAGTYIDYSVVPIQNTSQHKKPNVAQYLKPVGAVL